MKKKTEWSPDSTLVFLILISLHWSLKHISKINRNKFKFEIQSEKYGYGQRFQTSIPKSKSKIQTPI